MAKYQFSLEKVLDWRIDKENQAQMKVSHLEIQLVEEERTLERLLSESLKLKSARIFDGKVDQMRQQNLYEELTNQRIIKQKLVVNKCISQVEEAKAKLIEAHKEKKVLEKLKEKNHQTYIKEEQKFEQNQLDELAVLHYGRPMY